VNEPWELDEEGSGLAQRQVTVDALDGVLRAWKAGATRVSFPASASTGTFAQPVGLS